MRDDIATFKNGREMWHTYGCGMHYDPMENLYLGSYSQLMDAIKNKTIHRGDYWHDRIIQGRSLVTRIRVHDLFWETVADMIYHDLEHEISDEDGDSGDLWYDWNGFDDDDMEMVVGKYIGLLDPLTMQWVSTDHNDVVREKGVYTFNRDPAISEVDANFMYKELKVEDNDNAEIAIYEDAHEDLWNCVPTEIHKMYIEAQNIRYEAWKEGRLEYINKEET